MMQRTPNDPAWYKGGLFHDDQFLNVPGLWFMSWYDVSVGRTSPSTITCAGPPGRHRLAAVGRHRAGRALRLHPREREHRGGERSMGDARWNYQEVVYGFFDAS